MTTGKAAGGRKCLFCGGGKLSKEHVWSAWARDLLPSSAGYTEFTSTHRGGEFRDHRLIRDDQGSITSRRLKRVCKTCNNGWMSKEEVVARAAVTLIITGKHQHLTRELRHALRRWITMKLMVLDTMRDGEQAFTEPERRAFYEERDIPDALSIWLLRCGEEGWGSLFWSHAQSLTAVPENALAEAMPPLHGFPNRKMFLWGVGSALVAAVYQREIDISLNMQPEYSIELSPDLGVARLWPPKPINSQEARSLTLSMTTLPEFGGRVIELGDPRHPLMQQL